MMSKATKSFRHCRTLPSLKSQSYPKLHINNPLFSENQNVIDSVMFRTLYSNNVKNRLTNKSMCMYPSNKICSLQTPSVFSFPGKLI